MSDADISFHPRLGPLAMSLGWAPPLRYLLRRDRVLRLVSKLQRGDVLEVGCGAGALLAELARDGWRATGVETSTRALGMAKAIASASGHGVVVQSSLPNAAKSDFDLVCALDVLEHIEDDAAALREWVDLLRSTGYLLLSVPAHPSRWSAGDDWAGHFRRYTRSGLLGLLEGAGLKAMHLECYGFPLANLSEAFGATAYRRLMDRRAVGTSMAEASAESGVERDTAIRMMRWVQAPIGRLGLALGLKCQALTVQTDWGSGYLVMARRK